MTTSTDSLRKVFSARERGLIQLLLGLSIGGFLLTAYSYLKDSINLSPDVLAAMVVMMLLGAWGYLFRRSQSNEKRAVRAQEILQTDPSNLRVTVLQNGDRFIIEQVAKIKSSIGVVESTIGEKVELSREEAEVLGFYRQASNARSMLSFGATTPSTARARNERVDPVADLGAEEPAFAQTDGSSLN